MNIIKPFISGFLPTVWRGAKNIFSELKNILIGEGEKAVKSGIKTIGAKSLEHLKTIGARESSNINLGATKFLHSRPVVNLMSKLGIANELFDNPAISYGSRFKSRMNPSPQFNQIHDSLRNNLPNFGIIESDSIKNSFIPQSFNSSSIVNRLNLDLPTSYTQNQRNVNRSLIDYRDEYNNTDKKIKFLI